MIDPRGAGTPKLRIGRGATPRRAGAPLHAGDISIRSTDALTVAERQEMFALLRAARSGTSPERFHRDLGEQDWTLLLRNARSGELRGFSTVTRWRAAVAGEPVVALASGDTVLIGGRDGGEISAGAGRLLQHLLRVAGGEAPARTYWLLVRSKCDAEDVLARLFRDFHAAVNGSRTPPEAARILETLIRAKLTARFDREGSRVRDGEGTAFGTWIACGSGGRAERSPADLLRTAVAGDRYASLALLSPDNLTPLGQRLLRRCEPSSEPQAVKRRATAV